MVPDVSHDILVLFYANLTKYSLHRKLEYVDFTNTVLFYVICNEMCFLVDL